MANQGYWEKSRTHQFVALVKRLLRPSNLVATNLPQAGYVPSVGADDQFTWVAGGGGGGQVDTIVPGDGIDVDSTDPINPIVSAFLSTDVGNTIVFGTDGGLLNTGGSSSIDSGISAYFNSGRFILFDSSYQETLAALDQDLTLTDWAMESKQSGSIIMDIRVRSDTAPITSADSICGPSLRPRITAGTRNTGTTAGWPTVTLSRGDRVQFYVAKSDITNIRQVSLVLLGTSP